MFQSDVKNSIFARNYGTFSAKSLIAEMLLAGKNLFNVDFQTKTPTHRVL